MNNFYNFLSNDWVKKNNIEIFKSFSSLFKKKNYKKIIFIDGDYSINWETIQKIILKSFGKKNNLLWLIY
jgi:hypothetical protein|tara:strand:- start:2813 stop:3022 length:210 start_codon:yes stop_codon:yes gene_type:complete